MNWDIRTAQKCKLPELMGEEYCKDCRCFDYCHKRTQITFDDILKEGNQNEQFN